MNNNFIPQYRPTFAKKDLATRLSNYIETDGWLTEFMETKKFEQKIAEFLGVKHSIVVNNGTISLSLALLANGIKAGSKVLIPSLSMIATANAVKFIGAEPIFVDVDSKTLCMNIEQAYSIIHNDNYIDAIIYVSLNGRRRLTNELDILIKECEKQNVVFIEDAAQAFGSQDSKNTMIGNTEHICSFSFSVPKIISTGQGGALTTNDDILADKLRKLKDFGRTSGGNDIHDYFGINCKFTDLQAIVGLQQIESIKERVIKKKWMYHLYHSQLKDVVEFIPTNIKFTTPWFVDIYCDKCDELAAYLKTNNIGSRKTYSPIYSQKCYNLDLKHPVTERYCSRGLWLPSSLDLAEPQILNICKIIRRFFGE